MLKKIIHLLFILFFLKYSVLAYAKCIVGDDKDIAHLVEKKAKVKLVFFSTWCADCKDELEKIKKEKSTKEQVILINIFDPEKKADNVLKKFSLESYSCFIDTSKKIREKYKVTTVPKVIYINN
ncbi:TlpA family protein disulfide reductase [Fluviispira multicolorata]|uniref:Thioredoxin n=1 Tax=Fluviispira multicolorata TaxID=2654512 RepID=A0A833JEN3_9BACT|nr:redoxin domain-containing protein [Fluviispira multicolorata]KAB8033301.1 hypothetical protein GCL57_00980 [Fluviispira multicolorata]